MGGISPRCFIRLWQPGSNELENGQNMMPCMCATSSCIRQATIINFYTFIMHRSQSALRLSALSFCSVHPSPRNMRRNLVSFVYTVAVWGGGISATNTDTLSWGSYIFEFGIRSSSHLKPWF